MGIRDIIVVAFFAVSAPVCFLRPFYGVLLWMLVAFLNPHRFAWAVAQSFPLALLVAIPTLAGFIVFHRRFQNLASSKVLLLVVLWGWFTVTSIISTGTPMFMHHAADTWERWNFVTKMLLMTVVTIAIVDTFAQLRTLVLTVAGCFGFFVAKSFPFVVATAGAYRLYGPEQSMIADNNDFGLALNMTLPMFFFLAQAEQKVWVKRLFGFLFLITIPCIFFTYSRGALVGLLAVGAMMLLRLKQRFVLIPVIALAGLLGILFAPAKWQERMDLTSPKVVDASAMQRFNAWAYSWNLAMDYPIAGGGFATFTPELFGRYAPQGNVIHGPHSVYFGLIAEHGFVGLMLYLALVYSCFRTARRLRKAARYYGNDTVGHYANMIWFSIAAFLVSGTFLGRAYFDYYFTLVACIAILERVAAAEFDRNAEEMEDEEEDEDEEADSPEYAPRPVRTPS